MSKGRIHWGSNTWEKVAKNYAAIFVRLSQGGKTPPFRSVFQEAQHFLPSKQRRNGTVSHAKHCPQVFGKIVAAEIKRLTAVKSANGNRHVKVEERANDTQEIICVSNGIGIHFAFPPGVIPTDTFRAALTKAGLKFNKLDTLLTTKVFLDKGQVNVEKAYQ